MFCLSPGISLTSTPKVPIRTAFQHRRLLVMNEVSLIPAAEKYFFLFCTKWGYHTLGVIALRLTDRLYPQSVFSTLLNSGFSSNSQKLMLQNLLHPVPQPF